MRLDGLVMAFAFSIPILAFGQAGGDGGVSTCHDVSRAQQGLGTAYKGHVDNTDYRFSAIIPGGLTGWGAGPGAPFHGFIIYLSQNACINFDVGINVDLPEDAGSHRSHDETGRRIRVGNQFGSRTTETRTVNGAPIENVAITLDIVRPKRTDYVYITLIAPVSEKTAAESKLQEFLDHLKFR